MKWDWEDQTRKFAELINSFYNENTWKSLKLKQISKNLDKIYNDFIENISEDDLDQLDIDSDSYFLPHISFVSLKTFVSGVTKIIVHLNETEKFVAEKLLFKIAIRPGFLKESWELLSQIYLNLEDWIGSKHGYGILNNLYSKACNNK